MAPDFSGKVVLITGAGSGVGRATSIRLSQLGASLALCDFNQASLQATAAMCVGPGVQVSVFDVADPVACNQFVTSVVVRYHQLDHVFNCSVLDPIPHNTVAITDAYYDGLVNRKLKGLFNMTRACIPHLYAGASFVNASSTAGLGPIAWFSVYCAAQYGIIGFSKSLALELGPRGIRTNVVAHGFINTPTNAQNLQQLPGLANYYARISMGRLGEPEEVAEAVVFLMSNDSSYMNGSVMEVSGGIS